MDEAPSRIRRWVAGDPDIAARVNAALGKRVRLGYEHHRGVPPTCFGETEYFAEEVQPIE
jgi:hypothetical protein